MYQDNNLLFLFLKCALWNEVDGQFPDSLSKDVSEKLLCTAKDQTVYGLVADALIRKEVKLSSKDVFELVSFLANIKRQNQHLNDELRQFVNLSLEEYFVVKGQTIAALYPNPMLRTPGDIDFFVHDYKKTSSILQKEWNVVLPNRLIDKEAQFKHGGVTYEIHISLIEFGSRKHQKYWEQLMSRQVGYVNVDGVDVPTLEPTVYAAYVFVHLFFHFIREGVGLRQMCDWAIILHHYYKDIDQQELSTILKMLGMVKAYRAFGCILVDKLGLVEFPLLIKEKDRIRSKTILKDIMKGGNFGKKRKEIHVHGWKSKMRTMRFTFRNCFRYFPVAPTELSLMIPKLTWLNLKLIFSK